MWLVDDKQWPKWCTNDNNVPWSHIFVFDTHINSNDCRICCSWWRICGFPGYFPCHWQAACKQNGYKALRCDWSLYHDYAVWFYRDILLDIHATWCCQKRNRQVYTKVLLGNMLSARRHPFCEVSIDHCVKWWGFCLWALHSTKHKWVYFGFTQSAPACFVSRLKKLFALSLNHQCPGAWIYFDVIMTEGAHESHFLFQNLYMYSMCNEFWKVLKFTQFNRN